jgi:hypothetical protein
MYSPQTREIGEKRRRCRRRFKLIPNERLPRQISNSCTCFIPDIQYNAYVDFHNASFQTYASYRHSLIVLLPRIFFRWNSPDPQHPL